jgi:type II secretory pathway component GspD/PulD (secretin)
MKKFLVLSFITFICVSAIFAQSVTISFFQEPLTQALNDLATQEGITILTDSTIGGIITLNLNNVSISQALNLMLMSGGYAWKEIQPGVYFVGTPNPATNSFLYLAQMTPYQLKYINSKTLFSYLPAIMQPYVFSSTTSPYLIMIGAPDSIKSAIISLIKSVDVAPKDLVVQVNVLEMDKSLLDSWGISLQYSQPTGSSNSTTFNILNGAINAAFIINNLSILSNINALVSNGDIKTLADPKLRVQSGQTGTINSVTTTTYFYTTSAGQQTLSVPIGINLSITPTITASGVVLINFTETLTGASQQQTSSGIPNTMTNTLTTSFTTQVGNTVAVGGANFETYQTQNSKMPLLGDIPLIGFLFTQQNLMKIEKEIVVVITVEKAGD